MRVHDQKSVSSLQSARSGRTAAAPGARFSLNAGSSTATARMEAQAPISILGGLEALIALQSEEGGREKRARSARRGFRVLDLLDELKIAILGGRIPEQLQERLRAALQEDGATQDPRLDSLLEGIELRAEVELAKLRQAQREG
jgi:hypothetical protein